MTNEADKTHPADILVADDDASFRDAFSRMLQNRGYRTTTVGTPDSLLAALRDRTFDLVTLDLEWQAAGCSGVDLLKQIRETDPLVPVIMITGHATVTTAVEATRLGAFDYLEKMTDREKTLLTIRNAIDSGRLKRRLRDSVDKSLDEYRMIGGSRAMAEVREAITRFGPADVTVLIEGETGSGKELVARQLHLLSPRCNEEMAVVSGGELSNQLGQDTLFGHRHGAFTGTSKDRGGFIKSADKGTLFLDDITDLSMEMQPLLLRFLEAGDFMRLGEDQRGTADVRVIAATNQSIPALIEQKQFRSDLYYRLKVAAIRIPPLRERREDIPLLVDYVARTQAVRLLGREMAWDSGAVDVLIGRDWPGNVRELRNTVIHVLLRSRDRETVGPDDVTAVLERDTSANTTPLGCLKDMEASFRRECLIRAINACDGNITQAAALLGIDRSHLYRLIGEYDLGEYAKQLTS